ncbi:hypothetical protein LO763_14070, partial [Glycomyces sp. A-F 0318]
ATKQPPTTCSTTRNGVATPRPMADASAARNGTVGSLPSRTSTSGIHYEPPVPFDLDTRETQKWRNRIIDADLYWSHLKYDGDLLITRNSKDFIERGRREALLKLGGRGIEVPTDAVQWAAIALNDPAG